MGKLQELISSATKGASPVLFNYSEALPKEIAKHCGPDEVTELIAALDQLSATRDAHESGDESWDGDASDDIWRSQKRYASLLPELIARFPQQVAVGLSSAHSSTRFWIALTLESFPVREAIPHLVKALEHEANAGIRQVLEAAAHKCAAAR